LERGRNNLTDRGIDTTIVISVSKSIKADREFVFDWWTDLSPEDVKLVKPLKSRKIISKNPHEILLQDEEEMYFKKMRYDVRVMLFRPAKWISEYEGKDATAKSTYSLTSEADGCTTLHYSTSIEPKGFLTRTFSCIVKPFVRRVFVGEMDIFIGTLENEYLLKHVTG
jgi:hypothetical protein